LLLSVFGFVVLDSLIDVVVTELEHAISVAMERSSDRALGTFNSWICDRYGSLSVVIFSLGSTRTMEENMALGGNSVNSYCIAFGGKSWSNYRVSKGAFCSAPL
jgi:hypothetical protein